MPLIRRRSREAEPPTERLPDLEFLALVKASLERIAPGVTRGAQLKGNSLLSPRGWAVAVEPPHHGGGRHYDLLAWPDVRPQPEVPCFGDCVVAFAGAPRAADSWAQTAGACLLELIDRRERFADHLGAEDPRGIPGWHMIESGVVGVGMDPAENRRLQRALTEANVLHRVAGTFTADLEPRFFTGVKVFYGGLPGSMEAEIRIDGERHEAASAAMATLDLPEPSVFTAVRSYALLLPPSADDVEPSYPAVTLGLEDVAEEQGHIHGATCGCGEALDPEHPGFALPMPLPIAELFDEERARRVRVDTGVVMVADGIGNFLKVRLPIRLEDGRTVVYLVWVKLQAPVIEEFTRRVHAKDLDGHLFGGLLANAFGPWGEELLWAPVVLGGQQIGEDGSIGYSEVLESSRPLLGEVLREAWPAEFVLGDRDPGKGGVARG